MTLSYQSQARVIFLIGIILGILSTIGTISLYFHHTYTLNKRLKAHTLDLLNESRERIDAEFSSAIQATTDLAKELVTKSDSAENNLLLLLEKHPALSAIGVAFVPDKKPAAAQSGYYYNASEGPRYTALTEDVYTEPWFQEGLKGASWLNPSHSKRSDALILEYVAPFYNGSQDPIGVLFAQYNLKRIGKQLDYLDVGTNGYALILSKDGTLISHPVSALVNQNKTIFQLAEESDSKELKKVVETASHQLNGIYSYTDSLTHQPSWIAFDSLKSTGGYVVLNMVKSGLMNEYTHQQRHILIWILISLMLLFGSLILYIATNYIHITTYLWLGSALLSGLLIAGIGYVWYLQLYMNPIVVKHSSLMANKMAVSKFVEKATDMPTPPIKVPTGVYIRDVDFNDTQEIGILGYIWQKYPTTPPITPGFFITDATTKIKPVLTGIHKRDTYTTYAWNIYTKLYQNLDYKKFPFDHQHIRMHIQTQDPHVQTILVPDVAAYSLIHPSAKPGISPDPQISGWQVDQSYFSYDNPYDASHAKVAHYVGEEAPQLYYHIILKRNFLDPFIAYIIPLFIALFFLFITLVLVAQSVLWDPIALVSAIFFSVVVAHLNLRTKFSGQPIFYLEYFYIITYLVMFATVIAIFLIAKRHDHILISYKQGIIPKILYWPLLFLLCFIVTVTIFY